MFAWSAATSAVVAECRPPLTELLAAAAVGDIFLDADTVNVAISAALSADAEIISQKKFCHRRRSMQ